MKKLFSLILITLIYSCGYSAVYKDQEKYDLFINIKKTIGDYEINSFIKNDLRIASKSDSENIYNINFETKFEKITIAKDSAGKATDYRLELYAKFIITSKQNKILEFNENFKIKNNEEKFEQSNYEKDIKRNFSKIVSDKLVIYLNQNYDN